MNSTAGTPAIGPHCPPYFTPSQWQELEQQALIFKYILAGSPVPQQLIIPIVRSFNAFAARIHPHSPLSYGSLYGKKVDPEPGRCRRTDGKKWRCSKDAYPDSKYCERHMHRGRNRSRKPVEIPQPLTQSHHSSAPLSANANGSSGSFQNFTVCSGLRSTGDFRYPYGTKSTMDEHRFLSEPTSSSRGPALVDSSLDNTWDIMPSNERNYHQLHALPKPQHQQQQHLFFGREFDSSESINNEEAPSLQPCFNEWPKTRDLWSDLEDDRSNRTSSSPTQLSISIPMAYSSNFSTTTSSHSPNDD